MKCSMFNPKTLKRHEQVTGRINDWIAEGEQREKCVTLTQGSVTDNQYMKSPNEELQSAQKCSTLLLSAESCSEKKHEEESDWEMDLFKKKKKGQNFEEKVVFILSQLRNSLRAFSLNSALLSHTQ